MKVTALVTLSLTAVLLVLDFEPTCGIRLSDPYGEKHSVVATNGLPNPASLGGDTATASEHHHGTGINSGSSTSNHGGGTNSASNTDSANKLSNAENSVRKNKVRNSSPSNLRQTESIEDLIEAGLWQMPVQLWNYLPHSNSINNHHANVQIVDHHHDGQLNHHRRLDNTESDEQDDDDRRGASRHHLSFIPDPDNSVSIHVPSNHAFLGQRLVGFNKPHFSDLTQVYMHPDEDDNPPGGGGGGHPTILKRTHSDNSPIGSRKTEDRKRANRPYDVPQIECPPADDGMERFACPSPDRQGRYRCIDDHVLCDGFLDCPEGEDEDRHACMFYKTTKAHLDVLADALLRWARGKR